ncbi:hypothetical protein, partial [Bradyrhizobium brasilense]|uniref:hypothetical protein n=1 Tax=Bradyrhizobium brasilense TaxID=1419277 RepID=UPI001E5BF663
FWVQLLMDLPSWYSTPAPDAIRPSQIASSANCMLPGKELIGRVIVLTDGKAGAIIASGSVDRSTGC